MPSKKPNISELIDDIKGNKLGDKLNALEPNTNTHLFPDSGLAIRANALQDNTCKPIVVGTGKLGKELMQQALAEHILLQQRGIVITTKPRTIDEHSVIQSNSKDIKSLHNLPQAHDNIPSLTNKRDTADGLQGNSVDDETRHLTPTSYDIAIPKLSQEQKELIKVYGTAGETDKSVQQNDGNISVKNLLREIGESLANQADTILTIHNPYAPIEPIEDAEYYKQNAEYYLKEYLLIQQKISKLSSTKRRQIVHIVETYLLT